MRTNPIPLAVQVGGRVYSLLLVFYPFSLRAGFQQEMLSVFEDQIHFAWKQSGYRGVVQCWGRAIVELLCTTFTERLNSLKIPAVSILLSVFLTAFFFAKVVPHGPCPK